MIESRPRLFALPFVCLLMLIGNWLADKYLGEPSYWQLAAWGLTLALILGLVVWRFWPRTPKE